MDRQVTIDFESGTMRYAADARAHAGDAAEACRVAQRAAHVSAVGEPRCAGGQRDRGAAGGTCGGS